jgi:hypothetical protein
MNFLARHVQWLRAIGRKVLLAAMWTVAITGLVVSSPLIAKDYDQGGRGGRNMGHGQRDWRANDARNHQYRHVYRRPYVYAQPVYVPPPMYYEPRQSPGISLFFPLDLRQREERPRR